jgi:hypothetical protein
MGFFFRKSKSFGLFRLNFSKSGVGISTGVKGARVSVGPRGTELHLGRKGVYYRKKLGGGGAGETYSAPRLQPHYANLQYLTYDSNYFDVCRILGMPDNEITTVPPEAKIPNLMLHYKGQAVVFLIFATDWSGVNRFDTRYVGTKSLYPERTIHVSNPDHKLFLDSYPLTGQQPEAATVSPDLQISPQPPWFAAKVIVTFAVLMLLGLIIWMSIMLNDDNLKAKSAPSPLPTAAPTPTPTPVKRRASRH